MQNTRVTTALAKTGKGCWCKQTSAQYIDSLSRSNDDQPNKPPTRRISELERVSATHIIQSSSPACETSLRASANRVDISDDMSTFSASNPFEACIVPIRIGFVKRMSTHLLRSIFILYLYVCNYVQTRVLVGKVAGVTVI